MKRPILVAMASFVFGLCTNCARPSAATPHSLHEQSPALASDANDLVDPAASTLPLVHPLFSDHMVLQRERAVPIWGWTTPGGSVTVTIGRESYSASARADGRWQVNIAPFPAGGPYTVAIKGPGPGSEVSFHDVLFGDVWLCSGQSNMQMSTEQVLNTHEEINHASVAWMRLFQVPQTYSKSPQLLPGGTSTWTLTKPDTVAPFSAACFFYGRRLHEHLGVPIGLIHSSWGGTPAEAWTSRDQLATIADFRPLLEQLPQQAVDQNAVTVLYNGMIAPLIPYGIKGAAWYQGESNAGRPAQYTRLLPTLMNDWRRRFQSGEFPFLVVQLANYTAQQTSPVEDHSWAELREAQLDTVQSDANAGLALAIDLGEAWDIHPKDKQDVAERLALAAFRVAYGEEATPVQPVFAKAQAEPGHLRVSFHGADQGLMVARKKPLRSPEEMPGTPLQGFAVAGADGRFVWADAYIADGGRTVLVSSPQVLQPVAVRYDWASNPIGNLYSRDGYPIAPFRSDRTYGVGVVSGSGSGTYPAGAEVAIAAAAPPSGKAFVRWEGDTAALADSRSERTTLLMPKAYVSVQAVYE